MTYGGHHAHFLLKISIMTPIVLALMVMDAPRSKGHFGDGRGRPQV